MALKALSEQVSQKLGGIARIEVLDVNRREMTI